MRTIGAGTSPNHRKNHSSAVSDAIPKNFAKAREVPLQHWDCFQLLAAVMTVGHNLYSSDVPLRHFFSSLLEVLLEGDGYPRKLNFFRPQHSLETREKREANDA